MEGNNKNLYYLDSLSDYNVASGDPDVRGWDVKDAENHTIGKVDRLLVNKESRRVVYLDVEVDQALIEKGQETYQNSSEEGIHEFVNTKGENHLIIPIGMVKIDEENKNVISDKITYSTFVRTKRIRKGTDVDRHYEITVFEHYFPEMTVDNAELENGKFYNRSEFRRRSDLKG